MANIRDEVHELDETLKKVSALCEEKGENKFRNPVFKTLVREGQRRFTKYGYIFNGTCFVYRK